jgi:nicotinamidase-related amidase
MTEHDQLVQVIALKDQAPLAFAPARSALLIIDMQRYFVHGEYPFVQVMERMMPGIAQGYCQRVAASVIPNIQRLQAAFRARNLPVIYTGFGCSRPDGRDLVPWSREFDRLGLQLLGRRIWPQVTDPAYAIDDAVAPMAGELVLHKVTSGPLNSTKLDQILRHLELDSLVVTGLTTDVCVTQSARELADRGFQVIIAEDGCTTLSAQLHRAALQVFSLAFGRVRSSQQILELLAASPASAGGAMPGQYDRAPAEPQTSQQVSRS